MRSKNRIEILWIALAFVGVAILYALFYINPIISFDEDGKPQRIAPLLFPIIFVTFLGWLMRKQEEIDRLRYDPKALREKGWKDLNGWTKTMIDIETNDKYK